MTGARRTTINNTAKRRRTGKIPEWRAEDFRTIVTRNADAMVVLDREGYVVYVNPAAEYLFNLPTTEIAGANFGFPIVLEEPVELNILRGFKDFVAAEMRMVDVVWAGEPSYLLSFRDLTDRIKAEEALSQARDELEAMVNERTRGLSESNESLKREIDERKRAEEALQEGEEKFRVLTETAPAAICILQDGRFQYVNNATETITGYDRNALLSMEFLGLIHPGFRGYVAGLYSDWLNGQVRQARFEIKVVRKDGVERWLDISVSTIDYQSRPGLIMTAADVTERKRLEEKLAHIASFPELNPNPIFEVNEAGIITYSNPAANRLFPDLRALRTGHPMLKGIAPDVLNPDGKGELIRDVKINNTTYQQSIYYLPEWKTLRIYSRDITESKRAEEALREGEERFRALADNIPNLTWMANPDGWIFWYNKQWYDYTGTTLEEMQGWGWQKVHHPDYVKAVTEKWSASIKAGQPFESVFPLRGRDGMYRWFLTRVTPILDTNGNIQRWFGTNTDITERKQAEEALIESKQQAELYVDLMGHDINNMNHSAMGYLELALETLETEKRLRLDDKTLIERPMQALANSAMLIDNVRKLQSLMTGGVKTKPTDLDQILSELGAMSFYTSQDRDVTINIQHLPGIMVEANELLKDVFVNLVANAVKHSNEDKPLTVNVRVEPIDENDRKYYRCIVEDDGPGIPDELKNKLFHRFHRGATRAHGKGLGLYIVRTLVEGYHGKVWVEDRMPGDHTKGARFVVMLPAVEK